VKVHIFGEQLRESEGICDACRASGGGTTTASGRTKSCPMPYFGRQKPYAEIIAATALKLAQVCSLHFAFLHQGGPAVPVCLR